MSLARALTAIKGGARFGMALMRGDEAPERDREARIALCRRCPERRVVAPLGAVAESSWCGEPFVESDRSCGCLLAGKTAVASESCPQGRWNPVVPQSVRVSNGATALS